MLGERQRMRGDEKKTKRRAREGVIGEEGVHRGREREDEKKKGREDVERRGRKKERIGRPKKREKEGGKKENKGWDGVGEEKGQ